MSKNSFDNSFDYRLRPGSDSRQTIIDKMGPIYNSAERSAPIFAYLLEKYRSRLEDLPPRGLPSTVPSLLWFPFNKRSDRFVDKNSSAYSFSYSVDDLVELARGSGISDHQLSSLKRYLADVSIDGKVGRNTYVNRLSAQSCLQQVIEYCGLQMKAEMASHPSKSPSKSNPKRLSRLSTNRSRKKKAE